MKRAKKPFLELAMKTKALLFVLIFSGCQSYKSPLAYDPLYRQKNESLEAPAYQKADMEYANQGYFTADSGETTEHLKTRITNAIRTQEHDYAGLTSALADLTASIQELETYKQSLSAQNLDLRKQLAQKEEQRLARHDMPQFYRYTLQEGEDLADISQRFWQTRTGTSCIYRCNKDRFPQPFKPRAGDVLFIPNTEPSYVLALHRSHRL